MVVARQIPKAKAKRANRFNELRLQKTSDLIERYARRVHKHGQPDITSAHDTRHVTSVAGYAGRMTKYFGGTRTEILAARNAGHLHDRIRLATEELMGREEAITALGKFMNPKTPKAYIERLVDSAIEQRNKLGGKVSDYEQKNAVGKISSDELTGAFLRDKLSKNRRMKQSEIDDLVSTIIHAGKMPGKIDWRKNLPHSTLVFADKFFEANGAFVAFRRAYFMGERKDRQRQLASLVEYNKGLGLNEKQAFAEGMAHIVLDETNKRITAYSNLEKIPEVLHPFVKYQADWQFKLKAGLEKRAPWAMHLVVDLFGEGLKGHGEQISLEAAIKRFKPLTKNGADAQFKREAIDYMNGKLWNKFKTLVLRG